MFLSLIVYGSIFIQILMVGSEKYIIIKNNKNMCAMQQSAQFPSKVIPGSTKVVDFGTNRKRVFDFINSNLCRILHRFGDTAA